MKALHALCCFSSVVFTHPTKEQCALAQRLFDAGLLIRAKHEDENGVKRWAYQRSETGSAAIGAGFLVKT